jgi:hypothetical protein
MKKGLLYISVGLSVIAVTYWLLGGFKDKGKEDEEEEDNQDKPNTDVQGAIANNSILGKKIYTRIDGIKVRNTPQVNDGAFDNVYGSVALKNTLLGSVVKVIPQKGTKNPNTNKPYNWLSFKMEKAVYDEIQKNSKNFLTRDVFTNIPPPNRIYVREDVIKLTNK